MFVCFEGKELQIFDFDFETRNGWASELSYTQKKGGGEKQNKKVYLHLRFRVSFLLKLIRLVDSRSLSR